MVLDDACRILYEGRRPTEELEEGGRLEETGLGQEEREDMLSILGDTSYSSYHKHTAILWTILHVASQVHDRKL